MIYKKDKEKNNGKMDLVIKDFIKKVKNMDKENISGQINQFTKANGMKIKYVVKEYIHG